MIKDNKGMNVHFLCSNNRIQKIFSKVNFFKQTSLEDSFLTLVEDRYIIDNNLNYTNNNCIIFSSENDNLYIKNTIIVKNKERMLKIIDYFTFFFSLKKSFKLNLILLKLGFKPSNKSFIVKLLSFLM